MAQPALHPLPAAVQQLLEKVYEVRARHDVADFVVTDATLLHAVGSRHRQSAERLLVRQEQDGLELSLYLDAAVLNRLEGADPFAALHRGNLADFALVVEGVSHFLYVARSARFRRGVTLLELEMQAEVDKFVAALFLLGHQREGRVPARLHEWLFRDFSLDERLEHMERERYRRASHYAGEYCRRLSRRFLRGRRRPGFVKELRRFYRLPHSAKIRHIESDSLALG